MKSRNASVILWFSNPYNALRLHCGFGIETKHCTSAGKEGAVGIPKYYIIESKH